MSGLLLHDVFQMTRGRREEMQFYKEEAMMKEAKMKTCSHKKLLETVQQVIDRLDVSIIL